MITLGNILNISDQNEIKKLNKMVDKIDLLDDKISSLTDSELKNMTNLFKKRLQEGQTIDDILIEAFAVIREVSKRVLNMKQYRVQLIGGIVLHQGKIAEMKTGEGKTLVAVAPVYLNALTERGVHVVTVNDYLAKRDKEIMEPIYNFLDLSVGVILPNQTPEERRKQYQCDITYGTNNEFGFDYLKDNMVKKKEDMVQRELSFAIVDEVDSILIDEARTPLIISGQIHLDERSFRLATVFIKMLLPSDYVYEEKEKMMHLTNGGIKKAEMFFKIENLMDLKNLETYHHINQALKADLMMHRDINYVVKNGCVEIVDEFTGRVMEGRRFSEGLHQAIEAKENLEIKNESKTLATITYQNYFRMYKKLSGMTGTAKTEENEFEATYRMNVVQIPTNKPVIRRELEDEVYKTEVEKFKAVVNEIEEIHKTGQPVLVGTSSIQKSEILSYLLGLKNIEHNVLNAKNHEQEAEIVKKAGCINSITVATNMAGRGTDIALGAGDKEQEQKVKELGGLYVIGTEKNENRRIDDQLKGRSSRQGDPGVSKFYVSLEDDLVRLYGSSKIEKIAGKIDGNGALENKNLTKAINKAQINLESRNFSIRKEVLKYDDVINKQRNIIYKDRYSILQGDSVNEIINTMISDMISYGYDNYMPLENYTNYIQDLFNIDKLNLGNIKEDEIIKYTIDLVNNHYEENIKSHSDEYINMHKTNLLLMLMDKYWIEHIDLLDQLKKAVPLQAIAQKDPVKEYTREAFEMFDDMYLNIKIDAIRNLYKM